MKTYYEVHVLKPGYCHWSTVDVISDNYELAIKRTKKFAKSVIGKAYPGSSRKITKNRIRLVKVTDCKW